MAQPLKVKVTEDGTLQSHYDTILLSERKKVVFFLTVHYGHQSSIIGSISVLSDEFMRY